MARIRLKGINKVTTKLADGRTVTYTYAWKGGPRLPGKPGSPEFIASYNDAVASRKTPPQGVLRAILHRYQTNPQFRLLGERTRADYTDKIRRIEARFGDFPITGL